MSEKFDVVVIGGAVIGSSLAYFLAEDSGFKGRILVVEKDTSYARAASSLSLSSIRQQFSTRINIEASLFGLRFLRNANDLLAVEGVSPGLRLEENGYLYIATSEQGRETLRTNNVLQRKMGADVVLLTRDQVQEKYPWLKSDDISLCALGRSGEGWFDGYALMQAFKAKARELGVTYRQGKAVAIERKGNRLTGIILADGQTIACGTLVNCAGASGARVMAAAAGIAIPVFAKKRCVFSFAAKMVIPRCPLIVDSSGVYVRTDGQQYVCGYSPNDLDETDAATDFDVDWALFEDVIWPALAARVPLFEVIKPGRAWAGHYDMNIVDHNAIVGPLPGLQNFLIAAGFSGHGMQHAPAIGRGLAEFIQHGRYTTLDLSAYSFERIIRGEPILEHNVI